MGRENPKLGGAGAPPMTVILSCVGRIAPTSDAAAEFAVVAKFRLGAAVGHGPLSSTNLPTPCCPWRIKLAPRFSISKGASSFFSRVEGQSFFSQKGLAPGPFFFSVEGASSNFFRAKPYPNPQKFSGLRPPSGAAGLVLTLNGAAGWLWGV